MIGCFAALVLVGVMTFRHFGVTWDEPDVHRYGHLTLAFLSGTTPLQGWDAFGFYGPVMAVAQAVIDRLAGSAPLGYQLGHLLVYALFLAAALAFYDLCRRQFQGWVWGVLGVLFLVASPRVFSHAFVNSKDAPLMSLIVVAFYLLVRYFDTHRLRWIAAAGSVSALAIAVRVNALAIVGLVGIGLVFDFIAPGERMHRGARLMRASGTYAGLMIPLTVLFWPYLWVDPPRNLLMAVRRMAHYAWGPSTVLYRGDLVPVDALPWHYIPWWILITIPLPYLALAAIGLFGWPLRIASPSVAWSERRNVVLYGAWLSAPLAFVIVTDAVLYNEWRHLLFIYPPLVIFMVAGAVRVHGALDSVRVPRLQGVWAIALLAMIGWTCFRMAQLHPYQAIYFNSLVGGAAGAEGRYEMDYWGLSYKEGLTYLLRNVQGPIFVSACTQPGRYSELVLPEADASRITYADLRHADYAVCTPLEGDRPYLPDHRTLYTVERDGGTLLYVKDLVARGRERSEPR